MITENGFSDKTNLPLRRELAIDAHMFHEAGLLVRRGNNLYPDIFPEQELFSSTE